MALRMTLAALSHSAFIELGADFMLIMPLSSKFEFFYRFESNYEEKVVKDRNFDLPPTPDSINLSNEEEP